jgi:predicted restriction endonuclease
MQVFYVVVDPRDFSELSQLTETCEWKLDLKYKKIFDQIKNNDLIMFSKKSFHSWDTVLKIKEKKIFDNGVGNLEFRAKNKTLLLKFNNKDFSPMYSNSFNVKNLSKTIPGIYYLKNLKTEIKDKIPKEKKRGIPEKKFSVVKLVKRDRKKVANLKLEYLDKCQICNYRLVLENNRRHSEVHHLRPIGKEGGNDDTDNMIVLCPNHHKAFDYSVLRLDLSGKQVIDLNGNPLKNSKGEIQKVRFKRNHKLSKDNLTYQFYRRTS